MIVRRVILSLWIGLAVVLLVDGLIHVAQRKRADWLAQRLRQVTGFEREQIAGDLVHAELTLDQPRPAILVQAWGVLAGKRRSIIARNRIEERLERELGQCLSADVADEERLHGLWEIAAIIDAELAALIQVRIANRAGSRVVAVENLQRAASALATDPLGTEVAHIAAAWNGLRQAGTGPGWLTWAARQTPPQQGAIEALRQALHAALDARLAAEDGDGAAEVWRLLEVTDPAGAPPALRSRYAASMRYRQLPGIALASGSLIALVLFGGLFLAFSALVRRRRRFDPGAETIENVEPIDLETDAITLQREVTSEETRVD